MKRLIIVLCTSLSGIINLHAVTPKPFPVIIKGTAPVKPGFTLMLTCMSKMDDIKLPIDKNGRFEYKMHLNYPSQFRIEYGEKQDYSFYAFAADTIVIAIPSDTEEVKEIRGISIRSKAFITAEEKLFTEYLGWVRATRNYDSVLNRIKEAIKATPDIGNDDFTNVFAESATLELKSAILAHFQKHLDESHMKNLPWQDSRYEGIELYGFLMWPTWKERVEKEIIASHKDSTYKPTFQEILAKMELEKSKVLPTTYLNAKFGAIGEKGYSLGPYDKTYWEKEAQLFCKEYPNYKFTSALMKQYELEKNSGVGEPAPQFTLKDSLGKDVSFSKYKGKYVYLDVWGSWCGPCRQANKELVRLHELFKSKNIAFLGVARESGTTEWLDAIHHDKLTWEQLLSSKQFLEDYKITKYPTQFLIGPDQKILKRDNITENDIKDLK